MAEDTTTPVITAPTPPVSKPKKEGRRWFDGKYTEEQVIAKLEETAALDASVGECIYYADISEDSYYRYLKAHPSFASRLRKLRDRPILLARQTIVKKMTDSYGNSMDYLRRKKREEFGDSMDLTTKGRAINDLSQLSNEELRKIANEEESEKQESESGTEHSSEEGASEAVPA